MALSIDQLLSKAKSLTRKGDINTAKQIYGSVLQRFPKNKRAFDGLKALERQQPNPATLGAQPPQNQINALLTLLNQGQLDKVVKHATTLSRNYPNALVFHDLLGIAHMGLHNYDQCVASYQNALRIKPNFVEAHNNLGAALKAQGDLDAAIASYQKALQLKPDYAEAHNNLGIAHQENGHIFAAITSFENALQINPDYVEAHFNLGSALKENGALAKAIASFEKGLLINPNHAEAQNHLGSAQREYGLLDDAIESYKKSLRIKPDLAETYLNLGSALNAKGCLNATIANYRKALQLKPDFAVAYRNYTSAVKFKTEDEITRQITGLLKSNDLSEDDRMHLSFALAKVKLDMGQAADAIQLLKTGNALRKKALNYDISIDQDLFRDIKNLFAAESTITEKPIFKETSNPIPIFILGMPRSGTTLVEQIISSHSDVYGAGELRFLDQIIENIDLNMDSPNDGIIKNIRTEYYDSISELNTKQRFITDKMPANFRWIGFITKAFPEAKIIHTTRNPAAVCWSNFKLYFPANGMRYSFDMEDIARYYALYQDLMQFWHGQFPNRIHDINYEQLTENQLAETQKLLAYLGLNWQDTVMNFHKNTRSVATASSQQVRKKMYQGSSQEWEKYKDHLGPMLDILNTLAS